MIFENQIKKIMRNKKMSDSEVLEFLQKIDWTLSKDNDHIAPDAEKRPTLRFILTF